MKSISLLLFNLCLCLGLQAQKEKKLCIAFYNQENLFDTLDTPNKIDEEFLPGGTYKWNTEKYLNKIQHMTQVMMAMNNGKGPDFIGMCEVETEGPVQDLVKKFKSNKQEYAYLWHDSPDERGIDNALLYKPASVKSKSSRLYLIDTAGIGGDNTRGILMADFILKNNSRLILFVNHWPSRREGEKESEYKRIFVAGRLKKIADSIQSKDPKAAILIMGDFNDYPSNYSLLEVLEAKKDSKTLAANQYFNPMYTLMEQGMGSYKHRGEWNFLDQFILNQNLLHAENKLTYESNSANVFKQEWMLETEEKYKGSPMRTFGGKKYLNGYSDHLPVYLYLNMK